MWVMAGLIYICSAHKHCAELKHVGFLCKDPKKWKLWSLGTVLHKLFWWKTTFMWIYKCFPLILNKCCKYMFCFVLKRRVEKRYSSSFCSKLFCTMKWLSHVKFSHAALQHSKELKTRLPGRLWEIKPVTGQFSAHPSARTPSWPLMKSGVKIWGAVG